MFKVPAMIVLPRGALAADISVVRECVAEILFHRLHDDQKAIVAGLVEKFGWTLTLIPSSNHQGVIAGYGTLICFFWMVVLTSLHDYSVKEPASLVLGREPAV
jgi:threonine dehydratase